MAEDNSLSRAHQDAERKPRKSKPKLATFEEYEKMVADRPVKFNEKQVGFMPGEGTREESCYGCIHWFTSPQAERSVCEIFRPTGEDEGVRAVDVCLYFCGDSKTYPLLPPEIWKPDKPEGIEAPPEGSEENQNE